MAPDYSNSIDINDTVSESRLLSLESPIIPSGSSSRTGHGGDDLYLSDLSLSDQTAIMEKPFSLLARVERDPETPMRNDNPTSPERINNPLSDDEEDTPQTESAEAIQEQVAKRREEKLRADIFILKKLNASFELFNEALQETGSANQRIAGQLEQTNALLDKYIGILSRSEEFSRLIFDKEWHGADDDIDLIEREALEKAERLRREAEEKAIRAQQEALRVEREREEQARREEKERIEREKPTRAVRGGIRGVRGTRASMRATMRGSAIPRPETSSSSSTSRSIPRRPPSGLSRPGAPSTRG